MSQPSHQTLPVKRKIALVMSSFPPGRPKAQKMAQFLREDLCFDHVTYSKGLSQKGVHDQLTKMKQEANSWNGPGLLLVFVYYMGNWAAPHGEVVYTKDGDDINLKQQTVEMAANPQVHVVQWLESSLACQEQSQR